MCPLIFSNATGSFLRNLIVAEIGYSGIGCGQASPYHGC